MPPFVSGIFPPFAGGRHEHERCGGIQREFLHCRPGAGMALARIGVYALVLMVGPALLQDSDTYWQIAVGQWILDHHCIAARRHLLLHQGRRAMGVVVLAGAGAVCDEL
jgi:hypothetical protein